MSHQIITVIIAILDTFLRVDNIKLTHAYFTLKHRSPENHGTIFETQNMTCTVLNNAEPDF